MSDAPTRSGFRRAADAVMRASSRTQAQLGRSVELVKVRATSPMVKAEMYGSSDVIEEGVDLSLSQFVRWWNDNYTLQDGDTLLCAELENGSFVAFDVWADRPVAAGIRPSRPPAAAGGDMRAAQTAGSESGLFTMGSVPSGGGTPSVTWNYHLAKKLEVYDKDGNLLGYVPVFTTLP